jgi:hypothetical protein
MTTRYLFRAGGDLGRPTMIGGGGMPAEGDRTTRVRAGCWWRGRGRARRGGIVVVVGPSVTRASPPLSLCIGRCMQGESERSPRLRTGGDREVVLRWGRESPRAHVPARARVGPGHVTRSRGIARPRPRDLLYREDAHHTTTPRRRRRALVSGWLLFLAPASHD